MSEFFQLVGVVSQAFEPVLTSTELDRWALDFRLIGISKEPQVYQPTKGITKTKVLPLHAIMLLYGL